MKTTILTLSTFVMVSLAVSFSASAQKKVKDKVLAGKVFVVELTETTNKKVGKMVTEELSFKSEKINSKTIASLKFPASLYVILEVDSSSTPPSVLFSSEGKSQEGEDIKWEGTVTGPDIEGTAVISRKGKTKKEFAFTGSQKVKGGAKK